MCTVVFIPHNNEFFFASLRDESMERPRAIVPELDSNESISFLAPKDGLAGGTWLGINEMGNVIILLNGGFTKHFVKNHYPKSRGLIVTELLTSQTPVYDWNAMELHEIEPFTLVIWSNASLFELVWDGEQKNQVELDTCLSYIWSSSTLYNATAKAQREKLFKHWINNKPVVNMKSLLSFFLAEADTENGFIINRDEKIKTLSYSFITITEAGSGVMQYYDLLTNKISTNEIELVSDKSIHPVTHPL